MTKLSFAESFTRAIRAAKPEGWYARGGLVMAPLVLTSSCALRVVPAAVPAGLQRFLSLRCRPRFPPLKTHFFSQAALCRYVCPVIHRGADGG